MRLRVLAVCAGNICRSPTAVAAIEAEAEARGLDIDVDSAGTGSWNIGEPPTPQAMAAGARMGLSPGGRARKVNSADFDRFDVILAMDRSNYRDLIEMTPSLESRAKIRLFRTYDADAPDDQIPDPYGGPDEGYDRMVEMVRAAAAGFVDSLVSAGVEESVTLE
jgi:protein-tyrosine phosphatase